MTTLIDAVIGLLLDPGMIRYGVDTLRERYGTEWTTVDGREQTGSVRVRIRLTAPPGIYPESILLALQHDDQRRITVHVKYGETVLLRVPDGHFEILALYFGRKLSPDHKPALMAMAQAYQGLYIGKQREMLLRGRVPGPGDTATLLSAGPEYLLPFSLPSRTPPPLPVQRPRAANRLGERSGIAGELIARAAPTEPALPVRPRTRRNPARPAPAAGTGRPIPLPPGLAGLLAGTAPPQPTTHFSSRARPNPAHPSLAAGAGRQLAVPPGLAALLADMASTEPAPKPKKRGKQNPLPTIGPEGTLTQALENWQNSRGDGYPLRGKKRS